MCVFFFFFSKCIIVVRSVNIIPLASVFSFTCYTARGIKALLRVTGFHKGQGRRFDRALPKHKFIWLLQWTFKWLCQLFITFGEGAKLATKVRKIIKYNYILVWLEFIETFISQLSRQGLESYCVILFWIFRWDLNPQPVFQSR